MYMKTHIEIDETVLDQVIHLGHFDTKKTAVNKALEEYLKRLKRDELLRLRGKVEWEGDLDALRKNRV